MALPPVKDPSNVHRHLVPYALSLLSDEEPCAIFYDMTKFEDGLKEIKDAFPSTTLHAIAMKANPLAACLLAAKKEGFGCEVASPCELQHALRLGFEPCKIVMDSPAKTRRDIRIALEAGCCLNADNLEELQRIDEILSQQFGGGGKKGLGCCKSRIGVRVNPQLGEGTIAATGTTAKTSKFGVPLQEMKTELMECYKGYPWLTCVHCHVGSQGCGIDLLVHGAKSVVELADEINTYVSSDGNVHQIQVLDIGGGLAVDYTSDLRHDVLDDSDETNISAATYVSALRRCVPDLFNGKFGIVTEFGRYISAKCGLIISQIEYVKSAGGRKICVIHCGADVMLRTCYSPRNWPHRVSAWTEQGEFIDCSAHCDEVEWDVVGPLCFRGDIVAEKVLLSSTLRSGCHICIHDAGAYTLSMFSKYNSRQAPPVYGFTYKSANAHDIYQISSIGEFKLIKLSRGESVDEALSIWQLA